MLTSIEIAKLMIDQRKKADKRNSGFDGAILGLGVVHKEKKRKRA